MIQRHLKSISIIVVLCVVYGAISIGLRWNLQGPLSGEKHQIISAHSLLGAMNWYHDGPAQLKWANVILPKSIESTELTDRNIYYPYPVGWLLPLYLIAKIANHEPNEMMLRALNWGQHLLIGVLVALTLFFVLAQVGIKPPWSVLLAQVPAWFIYFNPVVMYWFHSVYFTDMAVILPFALVLFLEFLPSSWRGRWYKPVLGWVIFWGCFVDYLFFCVALVLFLRSIIDLRVRRWPQIRPAAKQYGLPALVSLAFFILHTIYLGGLGNVFQRFLYRTGTAGGGERYNDLFFEKFWSEYVFDTFDYWGQVLIIASLIFIVIIGYRLWRRLPILPAYEDTWRPLFDLLLVSYLPCILQIVALKNHSTMHAFSALKLALPVSFAAVALPLALIYFLPRQWTHIIDRRWRTFATVIILVPALELAHLSQYFTSIFPKEDYATAGLGRFIRENVQYNDVVVSTTVAAGQSLYDYMMLYYAYKPIHQVKTVGDIKQILNERKVHDSMVVIVEPEKKMQAYVKWLDPYKERLAVIEKGGYVIVKVPQRVFERLAEGPHFELPYADPTR